MLAAFAAVAETGSFTAAARKLERDASIVSRRVSQLEDQLGVRLLSRTTRRVALTEIGARYHRRIQAVLDELANASQEASEGASLPQGLLRVAVPVTFGRQWVAPQLPAFLASHPKIRIDARFSDRFVDVVAEGFDVAIRVGALSDSSLTARRLASYRNMLVAAPRYLAKSGQPRSPTELTSHAAIGFSGIASWPDWPLTKAGKSMTVRPNCQYIADNSDAVMMAVIAGNGIGYLPDWLVGPALRDGRLVEILPGWGGKGDGGVHAVMPPGRMIPSKSKVFVDAMASAFATGWTEAARRRR